MPDQPIYLDHSATTPVDPRVIEAMLPFWTAAYGNPSSVHHFGRGAKQGLETARRTIADLLQCRPAEIVFTGRGSESDNLAIRGAMLAARQSGRGNHLITSLIEHEAVLGTAEQLRNLFGFDVTIVGVDRYGRVDPAEIAAAIRPDTVLISIMAANNEIGTVQPFREIGVLARDRGVLFHSDAVQAVHLIDWNLREMPVDLLSLAPHKYCGPKGIGILYVREGVSLIPPNTGGGQENGLRPGTSNVAFAVGAARALELALANQAATQAHDRRLRDRLIAGLTAAFPLDEMMVTGHPTERLPHHASFSFKGLNGHEMLIQLDAAGIAASSGSACSSGNPEPSPVLQALGLSPEWTFGGLRLTVGRQTTEGEIEAALAAIPEAIRRLRQFTASFS